MTRTLFTAALLLALPAAALAAPSAPEAQQARPAPQQTLQERQDRRLEHLAEVLKLSADQKASIKAIHERNREAGKSRQEAAKNAAKAFREASEDPKVSTDQLRRLHQAMADARFEAMAARRTMRLEVRNLLTPEQREKAATLKGMGMERRRERMLRERGGRGPGMGEGSRGGREGRPGGRPGFEE
ncbi:MAG: Spy/CpxP family protein refolding chaperone [Holophagaceae bacterium]|nr:Spy/CpxP family protein refolding chaperone [Holophagaceae bacterium]